MNVFEAYLAEAKRSRNKDKLLDALAMMLARKKLAPEFAQLEAERKHMREHGVRRGDRNMMAFTMDLHPLELEAAKKLCPALQAHQAGDGRMRRADWQWIMSQPWAQAWQPPQVESVH